MAGISFLIYYARKMTSNWVQTTDFLLGLHNLAINSLLVITMRFDKRGMYYS